MNEGKTTDNRYKEQKPNRSFIMAPYLFTVNGLLSISSHHLITKSKAVRGQSLKTLGHKHFHGIWRTD